MRTLRRCKSSAGALPRGHFDRAVAQCKQNVWPQCRVTGRARSSKQIGQVSTSSASELLGEPSVLELNTGSPSASML